ARDEPPPEGERGAVVLELGQALARAGAPEAIPLLSESFELGEDRPTMAAAAIELSNMLFFGGRPAESAAVLRSAKARLPAGDPAREGIEVTLLGISYTSVAARGEADAALADRQEPDRAAHGALPAATLSTLAMDQVMYLGSAATA